MLLDDLVFRLEHYRNERWELEDACFGFYKTKPLVDQYAKFWSRRGTCSLKNILELGMWDGGSIAFWFELFGPEKHVGVDSQRRTDSDYFRWYVASRGLGARISTYWGTDQADETALWDIAEREFSGPLDLVIDDASHRYGPTKASFETLFPLLRPGGLYIIEDWAWAHWSEFQGPSHPWANETELTRLIVQLVELTGSSTEVIGSVVVYQGFAAVERGDAAFGSGRFEIESHISRRSPAPRAGPLSWIPRRTGQLLSRG